MRILFVTPDFTWPLRFGGEIRRWHLLKGLQAAGEVDAIVFRPGSSGPREPLEGCRNVFELDERYIRPSAEQRHAYESTVGRGLLLVRSALPFEYLGADRPELKRRVREIASSGYDLAVVAGARLGIPIGRFTHAPTILDGDDFSYVRNGQLLHNAPWYGAKIFDYADLAKLWLWERSLPRRYSVVIRCSEIDRLRQPATNVAVIPNGADVPASFVREPGRRALFVGDLGYAPNAQGMEWFLAHVWPRVRRELPDAEIDVVGRAPPGFAERHSGRDGVVVHGFVPDCDAAYRTASCAVVPLLAGSGTRLKILEALARAVPVVSTTIGAAGIDAAAEQGLERADDPAAFAARCAACLARNDADDAAAAAGREWVREHYEWTAVQARVAALARSTAAGRRNVRPEPRAV